jgi:peptidyl-prolyl cis-trans isomerase B (cyclophilin B)
MKPSDTRRRRLLRAIGSVGVAMAFVPVAQADEKRPDAGKASCPKSEKGKPMVRLETNFGNITLELNAEKAPKTVANFLHYVEKGFYDGTIFHRVIDGFMIQGGGFEPGMKQKPTDANIENEAANGLTNDAYTVAMARTPNPHSASSQFFINVKSNDFLNFTSPTPQGFGYCVFGKVVEGKEVVDKIRAVKTGSRGMHQDVPVEDVTIQKATVC